MSQIEHKYITGIENVFNNGESFLYSKESYLHFFHQRSGGGGGYLALEQPVNESCLPGTYFNL